MLDIRKSTLNHDDLVQVDTYVSNGHPRDRRDVAERHELQLRSTTKALLQKLTAKTEEYWNRLASFTGKLSSSSPTVSQADAKDARFYFWHAIALSPIEIVLGVLVGMQVFSQKLGVWRAVLGAAGAIILTLVSSGRARAVVFKREIPGPSREVLKRHFNFLSAAVMAAVGIFLLLRFSPLGRDVLFKVATSILSLALPCLVAVCFELYHSYRELNDLAHEFEAIEEEYLFARSVLTKAERLLAANHGLVTEEEVPASDPEPVTDKENEPKPAGALAPRNAISLIIFAFLIGLFTLTGAPLHASCPPVTVKLSLDTSGSGKTQALELVRAKIPAQVLKLPCIVSVEVQAFATMDEVLSATPVVVAIPPQRAVDKEELCGEVDEETTLWDDASRQYDKDCESKIQGFREAERRKRLQRLSAALRTLNLTREASQSCVYQAISKALAEPKGVVPIIVSDLKHENCPFPLGQITPLFGAPPGAHPIIIVVPSGGDTDPITAMSRRMEELRRRAPGVRLVPYTQIDRLF